MEEILRWILADICWDGWHRVCWKKNFGYVFEFFHFLIWFDVMWLIWNLDDNSILSHYSMLKNLLLTWGRKLRPSAPSNPCCCVHETPKYRHKSPFFPPTLGIELTKTWITEARNCQPTSTRHRHRHRHRTPNTNNINNKTTLPCPERVKNHDHYYYYYYG